MNADKQFLEEFINLYRLFPCLWNRKSRQYADRKLRNDAYSLLIEKCRERYPNANEDFVIKQIHNLRCSFRREFKKVTDSRKASRSSADDLYMPNLWYYDILSFTADNETPRNGTSNLEEDLNFAVNEDISDGETGSFDEISMAIQSPYGDINHPSSSASNTEVSRGKRTAYEQLALTTSKKFIKTPETSTGDEISMKIQYPFGDISHPPSSSSIASSTAVSRDEHEQLALTASKKFKKSPTETETEDDTSVVGKKYACDIKMLNEEQRIIAEKLISDVFYYAKLNKLNEHSKVELSVPQRQQMNQRCACGHHTSNPNLYVRPSVLLQTSQADTNVTTLFDTVVHKISTHFFNK